MKKYKCKHGVTVFSLEEDLEYQDCEYGCSGASDFKEVKNLTAEDYAEMWGDDLENENRHSLTNMPNEVLRTLEKHIKDTKVLSKIMKSLYESGIGLG